MAWEPNCEREGCSRWIFEGHPLLQVAYHSEIYGPGDERKARYTIDKEFCSVDCLVREIAREERDVNKKEGR